MARPGQKLERKFSFERELASQLHTLKDHPERLEQLERLRAKRPSAEDLDKRRAAAIQAAETAIQELKERKGK
jgi:hypothetical protein